MKKLIKNSTMLAVIISLASCAPKYTASFQQKSHDNNRLAKFEAQADAIDEELISDETLNNVQPEELMASTDAKAEESVKIRVQALVDNHKNKVEAITAMELTKKETRKAVKKENKIVKKELIKELKAAKKAGDDMVLMIILAIIIPPLGVGLVYGIGNEFWISLILTILFWLPGAIYSVIKVSEKY